MKKPKKDPIKHEEDYIQFLEKQIEWKKKQNNYIKNSPDVKELERKLSKARLILRLLWNKLP